MNPFKLDDVNKRNSSTWTACNNDSKSKKHRMTFLSMFGGEFVQDGKYVKWQTIQKPQPVYVPKRLLYFIDPNKQLLGIDNIPLCISWIFETVYKALNLVCAW